MTTAITFTGVDERTSPHQLRDLLRKYVDRKGVSVIEIGILRSPKVGQSPRYPGRDTIERITSVLKRGDLAFHLCGRYARMAVDGEWSELCDIIDFEKVNRVQVNVRGLTDAGIIRLQQFSSFIGRQVIVQWRGFDDEPSETLQKPFLPFIPGLDVLQDKSGGTGKFEGKWGSPDPRASRTKQFLGYAGGLNPSNIEQAMADILLTAENRDFWIDCESGIRTDDWFDIEKADAMAKAVFEARGWEIRNS